MICFAPLEPFDKNEQQLMQDTCMILSTPRQLHVDFDDDALRGEKSCQLEVMYVLLFLRI